MSFSLTPPGYGMQGIGQSPTAGNVAPNMQMPNQQLSPQQIMMMRALLARQQGVGQPGAMPGAGGPQMAQGPQPGMQHPMMPPPQPGMQQAPNNMPGAMQAVQASQQMQPPGQAPQQQPGPPGMAQQQGNPQQAYLAQLMRMFAPGQSGVTPDQMQQQGGGGGLG